jgi:hypothetical protein
VNWNVKSNAICAAPNSNALKSIFKFAFLLATLGAFAACSSTLPKTTHMNLFQTIDEVCKNGKCQVDLGKLVPGNWDRVAFVRMYSAQIAEKIGVTELEIPEFQEAILFIQGDKVLDKQVRDYDPEVPYNHTVFLDFGAERAKFLVFPKDSSGFMAELEEGEGIRNYTLRVLPQK